MAQKNAFPTKAQCAIIRRHGLNVLYWVVVKELKEALIIKHRDTQEVKLISRWPS